jgi:cytochrome c oxidase subunit II
MRGWLRALVSLALIVPIAGCTGWQSALDVHGEPAIGLRQLMTFIVIVCAIVWMLVVAVLGHALWRRRVGPPAFLALDPRLEKRMTMVVAAAVAITVFVVSGFTLASFFTTRGLRFATQDDLTIEVHGLQWWWEVKYPDQSAEKTFSTANEIHIPVRRNVRVQLEADDVIHSFWVPSLAGKQDLIPGRVNEITIRAERPGIYRGQCAEFCGVQHAHMAFFVVAHEAADFERWANLQRQPAAPPSDDEVATGQRLFMAKPCAACHAIRGTEAAGTTGPDLTHVGGRESIAAGLLPTTRGSLAAWIADPQTLKPGSNMPMVPLAADELRAISAYMASLK